MPFELCPAFEPDRGGGTPANIAFASSGGDFFKIIEWRPVILRCRPNNIGTFENIT